MKVIDVDALEDRWGRPLRDLTLEELEQLYGALVTELFQRCGDGTFPPSPPEPRYLLPDWALEPVT